MPFTTDKWINACIVLIVGVSVISIGGSLYVHYRNSYTPDLEKCLEEDPPSHCYVKFRRLQKMNRLSWSNYKPIDVLLQPVRRMYLNFVDAASSTVCHVDKCPGLHNVAKKEKGAYVLHTKEREATFHRSEFQCDQLLPTSICIQCENTPAERILQNAEVDNWEGWILSAPSEILINLPKPTLIFGISVFIRYNQKDLKNRPLPDQHPEFVDIYGLEKIYTRDISLGRFPFNESLPIKIISCPDAINILKFNFNKYLPVRYTFVIKVPSPRYFQLIKLNFTSSDRWLYFNFHKVKVHGFEREGEEGDVSNEEVEENYNTNCVAPPSFYY